MSKGKKKNSDKSDTQKLILITVLIELVKSIIELINKLLE